MRDRSCRGLCDEYLGRLTPWVPAAEVEVKEGRDGTPQQVADAEAERLLAALPAPSMVVALDERGEQRSSEELAQFLRDHRDGGTKDLRFVVGGAWGLAPSVLRRAGFRWSLGRLTLPHELARVVLWEQLYRGWTILQGAPYHHGGSVGGGPRSGAAHDG